MIDRTVLVYKRTHPGDPDDTGVFGCQDCMGRVRWIEFDAVIGIGGIGPEAWSYGIDGKLNWIGIGAHVSSAPADWDGWRGPLVTFDTFRRWEEHGPILAKIAPALAEKFYCSKAPRFAIKFNKREEQEIKKLLAMAKQKKSMRSNAAPSNGICRPRPGC